MMLPQLQRVLEFEDPQMDFLDSATTGFNISEEAFIKLNGGKVGGGTLQAEAKRFPRSF